MTATAVGTARTKSKSAAKDETPAHADPPGEMPEDLKAQGWTLKERVGEHKDRFQAVNTGLNIFTNPVLLPQDAIRAAQKAQAKHEATAKAKETGAGEAVALDRMPVLAREKRELPVPLTAGEIEERLIKWGDLETRKAELEGEAKRIADEFKGQVGQIASEIALVQKQLKARAEVREVETADRADYPNALVRMVRLDTGAEYDTRPMTQEELKQSQHRLPSV